MKNPVIVIIAIVILAVSFLIFTNTPFLVKGYMRFSGTAGNLVGPAVKVIGRPFQSVKSVFNGYINLVGARKENGTLKLRLETLELENRRIHELEKENERLRAILKFTEQAPVKTIAARVTGEDLKNWFKCIIVDKGRDSGISMKMPVITAKGIVGQVVQVNKWHSKVMIINDTNSSVDVYVEGKSTRGILEGTGEAVLKLKYIAKNDPVEIGDKLVASGKDGVYPKGLPTGIVITVNRSRPGIFAEIDVMPFNNFKRLDEVLIVRSQ